MGGITMTLQDFTKLLEDFAEATKNKKYAKISYEIWRCLKQFYGEVNLVKSAQGWTLSSLDSDLRVFCAWNDCSLGSYLENKFNNTTDNIKEKKKTMKLFDNFDFGPVDGDKVRMSAYGMAIKNAAGTWVAYDAKNKNIMDVEIFNIVIHMKKPAYVMEVKANSFMVIDAYDGSIKEILPVKNCFGFNYLTKVVSLVDFGNANSTNPFGNMLPFILMGSDNFDSDDILPLMLFSQSGNTNFMQNPMLMYFLLNKDGNSNMLLPLMLAGGSNPFNTVAPAAPSTNSNS